MRSENFKIESLSASPQLSMDLICHNPNGVGCRIANTTVTIMSGKDTLGVAISSAEVKLKPYSEFTLPVYTIVSLPVMFKLSGSLLSSKDIPVDLSGTFTLKKFIFKKKYKFSIREKINSKDFL